MSSTQPFSGSQRGVGLIEVMISVVIGMLLVLVIYQIYEVSEGQKRTITAGSDAQSNAAFGLFALARDLSMAGSGVASSATELDQCVLARAIPAVITAGAGPSDPDQITVFYGGSSSLSTPVPFMQNSTVTAYTVRGPVGFSRNDVVVAVQGANCTMATVDDTPAAVAVAPATGFATLTVTPVAGNLAGTYGAVASTLVNLGPARSMGRIVYSVDTATNALRTQRMLPAPDQPSPLVGDVINLKAQYGLDTNNDGVVDVWQVATGAWGSATVTAAAPPGPGPALATLQQIRAVRVAIVTRSAQYEREPITAGSPPGVASGNLGLFCDPAPTCAYTITLSADQQHFRYKILETIVPIRNALWNAPP